MISSPEIAVTRAVLPIVSPTTHAFVRYHAAEGIACVTLPALKNTDALVAETSTVNGYAPAPVNSTLSAGPGSALGDQFDGSEKRPPEVFVQ
jgi:hypothetical protein